MKKIFQLYNSICSKYQDSNILIDKLLSFLKDKPNIRDSLDDFLYNNLKVNNSIDPILVVELIGLIHQKKKENEKLVKTDKRKHFGIYYTDYEIARLLTKETLSLFSNKQDFTKLKFLEPCSGIGIFVLSYIDYIFSKKKNLNKKIIQTVVDNIYCADIDNEAIVLLKKIIPLYIENKYKTGIKLKETNFFSGDILFKKSGCNIIARNDPRELFKVSNGFDIVLTNPPYKLLKASSNKYFEDGSNNYAIDIKNLIDFIKKNNIYKYNEGTLNYYKIFVEEIIENYTHQKSKIGLLIPITFLNDRQSEKLRKRIIQNYSLSKVYVIPEKNNFFPDISQAFCFFGINKSEKGKILEINPQVISKNDFNNSSIRIDLETIKAISKSFPIIIEDKKGWEVLKKIKNYPKLKTLPDICNLRGELDLTLDKSFITTQKTNYPLVRGSNIEEFGFKIRNLFVDEKFILKLNGKQEHIKSDRLVCQQISNIHGNKRLKFTKVPSNIVLGNSCNYICTKHNLFENKKISLDYLLGVLNSLLIDWRFNVTNSNNHVSNYEIAELPIVLPNNTQKKNIERLVNKIMTHKRIEDKAKLNIEIFKLYQLTKDEILFILSKYRQEKLTNFLNSNLEYAL